ncbi:MAG: cytochrome d ubiquinol oxidase subunit II [Pseudomonadota bacterium]
MFIDYEILRLIWWLLLGVLLIGFAVMDGFDLGVAALLPVVAKNDPERRVAINTVGPVWEGNQVWLILGGGAIFAAWPSLYAVSFSGFYLAMFLVLTTLILRPVGFKFRSKIDAPGWRRTWDGALVIGGVVPALIFGVAVGNALQGVDFSFDRSLRATYEFGLLDLLNPFALLCGLVSLAMLLMHGASYLALKAGAPVCDRARKVGQLAALMLIVLFSLGGVWTAWGLEGYVIQAGADPSGPSNPLGKEVVRETGAWLNNYSNHGFFIIAPIMVYLGAFLALLAMRAAKDGMAFISSAFSVAGVVATAGVSMFPFLLPSSLDPASSLTVWDASSSQLTLLVMLIGALIFMPIIILYTSWVYRVLKGRVTADYIESNTHSSY